MARQMKRMLLCAMLALGAPWSVPLRAEQDAIAGVSATTVPLAEVLILASPYPNLRQEIRLARIAAAGGATPTCTARKLGSDWVQLQGRTIGPYYCRIGKRLLDITTRLTVFDRARHKIESSAPDSPRRAATLTETRLVWRWH